MQFAGGPRFIVTPLHSLQSSPLAAGGMKHHGGEVCKRVCFFKLQYLGVGKLEVLRKHLHWHLTSGYWRPC
jgi:hypothetical protein